MENEKLKEMLCSDEELAELVPLPENFKNPQIEDMFQEYKPLIKISIEAINLALDESKTQNKVDILALPDYSADFKKDELNFIADTVESMYRDKGWRIQKKLNPVDEEANSFKIHYTLQV
ncbi:hypothetical protein [Spartinivicinus ruber]|uniref:hypothetical protein n=1 Tax=Spartinivicinus ruber TaxID=2683272 RepID=UPI0013D1F2F9|nr:hypothetical protein [Spartinivicinus ruber]